MKSNGILKKISSNSNKKLSPVFIVPFLTILVFAGFILLSGSLTGQAIANLDSSTSSSIGTGLLMVSVLCGLFYLRKIRK